MPMELGLCKSLIFIKIMKSDKKVSIMYSLRECIVPSKPIERKALDQMLSIINRVFHTDDKHDCFIAPISWLGSNRNAQR